MSVLYIHIDSHSFPFIPEFIRLYDAVQSYIDTDDGIFHNLRDNGLSEYPLPDNSKFYKSIPISTKETYIRFIKLWA